MNRILLTAALITFAICPAYASEEHDKHSHHSKEQTKDNSKSTLPNHAEYQDVIEEYKKYLTTVPKPVREEIVAYRQKISQLNRQKIALFKGLTQEAQAHLAQEKKFKQKLPVRDGGKILKEAATE